MESLNVKYDAIVILLRAFEIAINLYHEAKDDFKVDVAVKEAFRDSAIKRFELSYELFWKYLREYIGISQGVFGDSPRKVFDLCFQYSISNADETQLLFNMIKSRNLTTHTYDVNLANEMADKIVEYYEMMHVFVARTSPDTIKK
ncbi:MAG TPA: HI0074 family nucleotidyltransferase substrate-binding subunit [Candidatus Babeliales bacterium]|jgi:nucleotidyltransferase substrate binding protein (TIGR01987 family)|nr:HI0074 family nucleotidyltransferase substrate-binding subunit [Candidatus Babeliales bacterium]